MDAIRRAEGPEAELNLTPMIDVTFLLLVFFLLTLRFHDAERQITAELPQQGIHPILVRTVPEPAVRASLFRREGPDGAPLTRVRLGGRATFDLPAHGDARPVRAAIAAAIREAVSAIGGPVVRGEVATPPPSGRLVPHGDVVTVIDAFLEAGVRDVRFEGARLPR